MNIRDAYFLKSCSAVSQFPHYPYPEFAFFGRSNVGKSSLINMLLKRKDLVKTGSKPGVTKTVNFFIVNNTISIADLPGFGYAKVSLDLKKKFMPLMKNYIAVREILKLAFLLIDVRRVPDHFEQELLSLLTGKKIPIAIVITKCDKVSRGNAKQNMQLIADALGVSLESLFPTSAKSGNGRRELIRVMDEYSLSAPRG